MWCATAVGVAGAVVLLVGWFGGVEQLRNVLPGLVTMKANTSLGFVLIGVAANPLVRERHRPVSDVAAALLLLLGALTVTEYAADVSLGIDELLIDDPTATPGAAPGRPGLNTALGFVLMGLGSLAGDHRNARLARLVAQAGALLVVGLSLLALLGYLLGASAARGLGSATEMALHTSILFVLAGIGLAAKTADIGLLTVLVSRADTGRNARVLLPTTLLASLAGIGAVELLARLGLLGDVRLQLALSATVSLAVVAVSVLVAMQLLAGLEERADEDRAELAAVRAAFPDVHIRVDRDDVVATVAGDAAQFGLPGVVPRAQFPVAVEAVGEDVVAALARSRAEGRLVGLTYEATVDGRPGSFEARFVPFGHGDIAIAVRDVTELAAAERELHLLNEELAGVNDSLEEQVAERTAELARSNRDLERFAYLASHDLQEPLRMVTGFVSRIGDRYGDQLDERGREYVHFAVDGARRMQALIEGLLAYSRAGRLDPAKVVTTDLADVITDVADAAGDLIDDAGATVELARSPAVVSGDPILLRQVVHNLLGNAVKYTRPDVPPVVTIGSATRDGEAVLWVEDNGRGLAPEHRATAFEMFRRFGTDPDHRGAGIGLSLVDQIVTAHGGRVDVRDGAGGVGTRFTVVLPGTDEGT